MRYINQMDQNANNLLRWDDSAESSLYSTRFFIKMNDSGESRIDSESFPTMAQNINPYYSSVPYRNWDKRGIILICTNSYCNTIPYFEGQWGIRMFIKYSFMQYGRFPGSPIKPLISCAPYFCCMVQHFHMKKRTILLDFVSSHERG